MNTLVLTKNVSEAFLAVQRVISSSTRYQDEQKLFSSLQFEFRRGSVEEIVGERLLNRLESVMSQSQFKDFIEYFSSTVEFRGTLEVFYDLIRILSSSERMVEYRFNSCDDELQPIVLEYELTQGNSGQSDLVEGSPRIAIDFAGISYSKAMTILDFLSVECPVGVVLEPYGLALESGEKFLDTISAPFNGKQLDQQLQSEMVVGDAL